MGCCESRPTHNGSGGTRTGGKPYRRSRLKWKSDTSMTRSELESQRETFWATAPTYEGRPEIWQALHAVVTSDDVQLARSILEAANITLPTGDLSDGCFDELGNRYEIPVYCLADPTNLLQDSNGGDSNHDMKRKPSTSTSTSTSLSMRRSTGASHSTPSGSMPTSKHEVVEESMPTPDPSADFPITVRLSIGKDIKLHINSQHETIATLRSRIYAHPEIGLSSETYFIRFIYLAHVLKDDLSIMCDPATPAAAFQDAFAEKNSVRIRPNTVIQALIIKRTS
ncbi:uncharacterized protein BYT42DRAFT_585868 [Radiomyces spectabilis]|uniref:uncharacterized protein n=1 Tax=Radiomyces spectabilis TaxID=64574 RepID=UPI00221F8301|nr:uncharacterized protein BYT42DRAFT_585868 [Radiomyces spectabilis]KAI8368239.1 hypothetical protein BYT42DRAFT_585868 [Radiomyces spectabilis]